MSALHHPARVFKAKAFTKEIESLWETRQDILRAERAVRKEEARAELNARARRKRWTALNEANAVWEWWRDDLFRRVQLKDVFR